MRESNLVVRGHGVGAQAHTVQPTQPELRRHRDCVGLERHLEPRRRQTGHGGRELWIDSNRRQRCRPRIWADHGAQCPRGVEQRAVPRASAIERRRQVGEIVVPQTQRPNYRIAETAAEEQLVANYD